MILSVLNVVEAWNEITWGEAIRQVVREEIYIQLVNNWPKSSGPVKGVTVPKQDYKKQVPQER